MTWSFSEPLYCVKQYMSYIEQRTGLFTFPYPQHLNLGKNVTIIWISKNASKMLLNCLSHRQSTAQEFASFWEPECQEEVYKNTFCDMCSKWYDYQWAMESPLKADYCDHLLNLDISPKPFLGTFQDTLILLV